MNNFIEKYNLALKTTVLVLMLLIPFFLYAAAWSDSIFQVNLFLSFMIAIMILVMVKG